MFKTTRLTARNFTIDDVKILNELQSDERVVKTTSGRPQTLEETKKELKEIIKHQDKYGISQMAIFYEGDFIGRCGIIYRPFETDTDYNYEIRYALHHDFQGKGFGFEIAKGCVDFAFKNHLKIKKIIAGVRIDGCESSDKILLKLNFKYSGNKIYRGNKVETKMYEITRNEWLNL